MHSVIAVSNTPKADAWFEVFESTYLQRRLPWNVEKHAERMQTRRAMTAARVRYNDPSDVPGPV